MKRARGSLNRWLKTQIGQGGYHGPHPACGREACLRPTDLHLQEASTVSFPFDLMSEEKVDPPFLNVHKLSKDRGLSDQGQVQTLDSLVHRSCSG